MEKVKEKQKFVALVRKERNGDVKHIKASANSKYAFRQKLKEKALRVIVILSKDEVKEIKQLDEDEFLQSKLTKLAESERKRIYEYVSDQI